MGLDRVTYRLGPPTLTQVNGREALVLLGTMREAGEV